METQATISDMGSLARGTAINLVGSSFSIGGRLLYNLLVARILGPSQLGVYFLALTLANVTATAGLAGLENTAVRFLARDRTSGDWGAFRGNLRFILGLVSGLTLLAGAGLWLLAPWLTATFFHKPEVATPLRVISIYVPLFAMETVLLAATQSFRQMKYKACIESMLNPGLRIVAAFAIYKLGGGIYAILGSYVGVVGICTFLAGIALRRCIPVNLSSYRPVIHRAALLDYSFPLFGSNVLTFLVLYADSLVLAHYRSNAEVGMYAVCIRLIAITAFSLPVVSQIFAPMISELHHRNEIEQLGRYFKVVTLWAAEIFVPLALLYCVAGREILGFFGPGFSAAAPCLFILAVGQLANVVTGPVGLILNMAGWTRLQLLNSAAVLLIQIGMSVLLIPRFGIMGAAVANGFAAVAVNVLRVFQLQSRLQVHPFSAALAKPAVAALVSLIPAWAIWHDAPSLGTMRLVLLWVAMIIAYGGMLFAIGLDRHSRVAWEHLRRSIAQILLRHPALAGTGRNV